MLQCFVTKIIFHCPNTQSRSSKRLNCSIMTLNSSVYFLLPMLPCCAPNGRQLWLSASWMNLVIFYFFIEISFTINLSQEGGKHKTNGFVESFNLVWLSKDFYWGSFDHSLRIICIIITKSIESASKDYWNHWHILRRVRNVKHPDKIWQTYSVNCLLVKYCRLTRHKNRYFLWIRLDWFSDTKNSDK